MIEHTVKDHPDSLLMTGSHKILQVFIGSQSGIQLLVIGSLIAMSHTLK